MCLHLPRLYCLPTRRIALLLCSGLKKGTRESGLEAHGEAEEADATKSCVMLDDVDALTLAASMVDALGGLRAAEKVFDEALTIVRTEITASYDGGTNEWRNYFSERPSKGPTFFNQLSSKKGGGGGQTPKVYTGL